MMVAQSPLGRSEEQLLLDEYVNETLVKIEPSQQPYVVAMVGLPGSGKSTFAAALHGTIGIYIARNDDVRRFLNRKGFDGASPIQSTVEFINNAVTDELFRRKISHIRDADIIKFHEVAAEKAAQYDIPMILVKIDCSDEILLKRAAARDQERADKIVDAYQSQAGTTELQQRRAVHQQVTEPQYDYIYRSDSQPVEDGVREFCAILSSKGLI